MKKQGQPQDQAQANVPKPPKPTEAVPKSTALAAKQAPAVAVTDDGIEGVKKAKREAWLVRAAVVTALISAIATLPGLLMLHHQVSSLAATTKAASAQAEQISSTLQEGRPHLEVRWFTVPLEGTRVDPVEMLGRALASKEKTQFLRPQLAGATLDSYPKLDMESFVKTATCACPALRGDLQARRYRLGLRPSWSFLVITQDGKQSAFDVNIDTREMPAGALSFYNLNDVYSDDRENPKAPLEIFPRYPVKQFRIGSMVPGSTVVMPLFFAVETYTAKSGDVHDGGEIPDSSDIIGMRAMSETFLPLTLTYRPASSETPEQVNIREPGQNPLLLRDGIEVRG